MNQSTANTTFEVGCNLPGLMSVTAGLYGSSISVNGNHSPPTMALVFQFDGNETRRRFDRVRIENVGDGEYLARLMPEAAANREFFRKGSNAAVKLSDYNKSNETATAFRGQQYLGLYEVKSVSSQNMVCISSISDVIEGLYGPEMHIYFTLEMARNVTATTTPVAPTPVAPTIPTGTPTATGTSTTSTILSNNDFEINLNLPVEVISKLHDVAKLRGEKVVYMM